MIIPIPEAFELAAQEAREIAHREGGRDRRRSHGALPRGRHQLHAPTRSWLRCASGCLSHRIVPVLCGSAFKNKGVQQLLDAIVDFLPSPVDVDDIVG
jgi:hypothetical protein